MKITFLAILFLTLFGCASTSQFVKYPRGESLGSGTARIYVLRPSILGGGIKMKVYANDRIIGKTGPKSYLCWDVKVGEYTLKSVAENVDYFTINAKAGKTYFIVQKPKFGIVSYRASLQILEEKEGSDILSKLKHPHVKYAE